MEHLLSFTKEETNLVEDVQALYHENDEKSVSMIYSTAPISQTLLGKISLCFNSIDSTFANHYI